MVAIANQGRRLDHENTLTNAAAAVFAISTSDFHDVTSGSDGGHSATKGYDEVTGLGTPQANLVAQGLLGVTAAQQTYTTIAASTATNCDRPPSPTRSTSQDPTIRSSMLIVGVAFTQTQGNNLGKHARAGGFAVRPAAGSLSASGGLATPPGIAASGGALTAAAAPRGDTGRPRRMNPMLLIQPRAAPARA